MASAPDPVEIMTAGSVILGQVLWPAGFTFQLTGQGHGSGGAFATGRFTKASQYLEIHFRHSLGLFSYGWGDAALSHAGYLRDWAHLAPIRGMALIRWTGFASLPWIWPARSRGSATETAVNMTGPGAPLLRSTVGSCLDR